MNIAQICSDLDIDRIEIRIYKSWVMDESRAELEIDISYYFNVARHQPFSIREFTVGSLTHTLLTHIEEHIREDYK